MNSNIIIIVNDNEMSIAENHGGLYGNLRLLRQTGGKAECNMFKALGFDYRYLEEGNDIAKLTSLMKEVKDTDKPTVLHIHTEKGKGYKPAEEHKETWHWSVPFDIASGNPTVDLSGENYNSITVNYLQEKIAKDKKVVLINAGTPGAIGMTPDMRQKFGRNFVDFGIGWNGISGGDATHLGTFDIPLISNIPNLVYLAPTTKEEYLSMLDWGIEQTAHPVVIRIPSTVAHAEKETEKTFERLNTYKVEQQGSNVALIAAGSFFELGRRAAAKLAEQGITATLVNPRYLTGLDENLLNSLKADHKIVATLEDGELDGGFGEKIARFYGDSNMKVLNFGAKKEFTDRVPVEELYKRYHLTPELIAADILKAGN